MHSLTLLGFTLYLSIENNCFDGGLAISTNSSQVKEPDVEHMVQSNLTLYSFVIHQVFAR